MGMLLRRKNRTPEVQPTINGKPVVKEPKTKKLNKEPDYVKKNDDVIPTKNI